MDWFGDDVADSYDADSAPMFEPTTLEPQLDLLEALAEGGPVLELAIGTGRVAIPLSARGLRVSGIELSEAMLARMRAKPGGDAASIPVTLGDMAGVRTPGAGTFRLAYLLFNTIMNITSQDAQVECFGNVAAHLAPGGRFLVEVGVPALRQLPPGARYVVFDHGTSHVGIDEYEVATQGMWSHHIDFQSDGRVRRTSPPFRYVWPAELDLMARIAGMSLEDRWGDWRRGPFTVREHVPRVGVAYAVLTGSSNASGAAPASAPPLAQPLPRVAARAEDAGLSRQRLATEDERLGMVGREVAGSHRVRLRDASPGRSSREARPRPRPSASPAVATLTSAGSDGRACGGSGWRSPGGRSDRSAARSSSASRRSRCGSRSPDRRRRASEPSTVSRPRAAARRGGARSAPSRSQAVARVTGSCRSSRARMISPTTSG